MNDTMQTKPIPSTGEPIGVIGLGTYVGFDVRQSPGSYARLQQVLNELFAAGGAVVDSSPMYGRAEAVTGDLLAASATRGKAFVATKVWTRGEAAGVAQMNRSMELMHADPIDLMQIHNLVDWRAHLKTLRAWKHAGRVRHIGITHYTSSAYDDLEAVMRAEPLDFLQLNYSARDRKAEERLLPLAIDRNVAVIANYPLASGEAARTASPLPDIAHALNCTSWAQLLLKFVVSHPAITCAIPGTGNPEHMAENARAGFGPMPDAKMREEIARAYRE